MAGIVERWGVDKDAIYRRDEKNPGAYQAFQIIRNVLMQQNPKKPTEDHRQYTLRIVGDAEDRQLWLAKASGDGYVVEQARTQGRSCLEKMARAEREYANLPQYQEFMRDAGYSMMCNVYQFTAPLDAWNYRNMNLGQTKPISSWAQVAAINEAAVDRVNTIFLDVVKKELAAGRDSLPTAFVDAILKDIRGTDVEDAILAPHLAAARARVN